MNVVQLMSSMEQVEVRDIVYRKSMTFSEYLDLSAECGLGRIRFDGINEAACDLDDDGYMILKNNLIATWEKVSTQDSSKHTVLTPMMW